MADDRVTRSIDPARSIEEQNDELSARFPSTTIATGGHSVHVYDVAGETSIWLNNEDHDFTGLCLVHEPSRAEALREAIAVLAAARGELVRQLHIEEGGR